MAIKIMLMALFKRWVFMRNFICLTFIVFSWVFLASWAYAYSAELFAESQSSYTFSKTKRDVISQFRFVQKTANRNTTSLDQMIGQMLMLGFAGTKPGDKSVQAARKLLAKGQIGGLICMGNNVQDRAQVRTLVTYMKSAAPLDRPAFIAIDQEGGQVQRLRAAHGFTDMPQAVELAKNGGAKKARQTYQLMAKELSAVGFNMNFGPVVDLNLNEQNPIIAQKGRSYGKTPQQVQGFARAFVEAHRRYNILTALKHFPGHGSSWTDSHEQFVDLSSSWRKSELIPYQSMSKKGLADMVMVGHLYHPQFSDKGKIPASLSRKAIQTQLRGKLGYQGLVITDDLGMGAIKKHFSFTETIIRAVQAGNDILLLVDDKLANAQKIAEIHMIIRKAVADKKISSEQIKAAYERIMAAKKRLSVHASGAL